ncbi:EpsD family peptidyl-prolyl cis-trans isomerase [Piscinibacter gummiphilus]|uniref:peptidylprolyl isomerase n=1 Tax=Piscinibacter gummiphilus TaxID=946333 RepID=A0ABZ0CR79_9BURK|nr:EpsD family peptidyl-prolyl cis-trans isomerase [Piscinibacter gummiphilus]WOB07011.1 EpsD family peptidyl-prolyl cis-trans isomerase [Piscinibacter gummiphilus]
MLLLAAAAVALSACGGKPRDANTQIAAKVNREEISVHQVNYFLQRQGAVAPDQVDAAGRQTLEALVDQEVAVQAAIEQKLDRDPMVVQSLEAARRELLARAYAERLAQSVSPPTPQEVKQYYDSKPALFARRRLYTLVDTAIEATPEQQKPIEAQMPTTRGTADVSLVLRQAGVRFGSRRTTIGAEALPLHAVDAMAALNEGQSLLVGGPRDAHIYTVIETRPAPLNLEEARGAIENFLIAERRRTALEQQIKALRSNARIEYRGRFAQPASAPATPVATTAPATPVAAAASAVQPDTSPVDNAVALEERSRSLTKTTYPNK